jgi:hypothetical protein
MRMDQVRIHHCGCLEKLDLFITTMEYFFWYKNLNSWRQFSCTSIPYTARDNVDGWGKIWMELVLQ